MTKVFALVQEIPETLESPLPGGVASVVRWFFQVPPWIQKSGIALAVLLFIALAFLVWNRRTVIHRWLVTRSVAVKGGLAVFLFFILVAAAGLYNVSWQYMQHDNDFCTGCHVMSSAFSRFTESGHSELQCHDCHRQSIFASSRQLFLWIKERPQEIGKHAPVPNAICGECHITQDPDSSWAQIAATAGHRVHFESDSAALAEVLCVDCHGAEVHTFAPAAQTCGQDGCHESEDTRLVLGKMAEQTQAHCVSCHAFTADVSEQVTSDSVRLALVPTLTQCASCHEMEPLLARFDTAADPHGGVCGDCHDPHSHETPEAAFATCTDAGCHDDAEEASPYHRGLRAGILAECGDCHEGHTWLVDGRNCAACHADILMRTASTGGPPVQMNSAAEGPADSWMALAAHGPATSHNSAETARMASKARARIDQQKWAFEHLEHRAVDCIECHSVADSHGALTVRTRDDCTRCHHSDPVVTVGCVACHGDVDLAERTDVAEVIEMGVWDTPVERSLPFEHRPHNALECADCHTGNLANVITACGYCHTEHHVATSDCTACHLEPPADAHPLTIHDGSCTGSGCHASTAYDFDNLGPTRLYCLTCHTDQLDHEPESVCTQCHLIPGGERISSEVSG